MRLQSKWSALGEEGSYLLGPFFCSFSLSEEDESSVDSSSEVVPLSSSSSLSDAPAQKREACSVQTSVTSCI